MNKQKLYNDFIQECYEFFERMSRKYDDIIDTDTPRIDIKMVKREFIPVFDEINYVTRNYPIAEVTIKFNVLCDDEKLKGK